MRQVGVTARRGCLLWQGLAQIAFKNAVACIAAIAGPGSISKFPQCTRTALGHAGQQLSLGNFAASADDGSGQHVDRAFGERRFSRLSGFNHVRSSIFRVTHARLPLRFSV